MLPSKSLVMSRADHVETYQRHRTHALAALRFISGADYRELPSESRAELRETFVDEMCAAQYHYTAAMLLGETE